METNNNLRSILEKLYKKTGYFDMYGGSIVSTIMILFIFFVIISYFHVISNIKPIKAKWSTQKCNPSVIPFAGIINKPPNKTAFEFTGDNFNECLNGILTNLTGDFLEPIYYIINTIHSSLKNLSKDIQIVRKKIESLVGNLVSIDSEIMGRILGFTMPIRKIIIKLKDSFSKVLGVGITGAYTTLGLWLSIKTFIGAFIEMMITGLGILAAIIVPLWILPFTWGVAITYTTFFAFVAAILAIVIKETEDIIGSDLKVPDKPSCFDENTDIYLEDGTCRKIKNLTLGMKLSDGGVITSILKVAQNNMDMYTYKNVIVSDNHNVLYNNEWVPVSDIPQAVKIPFYNKPYLYCLNTTTKKIIINDVIFSDWDDIDNNELIMLRKTMHEKFGLQIHYNNMHQYMEGGFTDESTVELEDGRTISISELEVNDILGMGNIVKGIVKISTENVEILRVNINDEIISSGPNNIVNDEDLGKFSTLEIPAITLSPRKKPDFLYHIITNDGKICINGIIFKDYNGCMEHFLEKSLNN